MFTTYGALIGLLLAVVLIIRKVVPAYALIIGALVGGLIGGGGLGAIALQYGYYRYQKDVLFTTVTLLIIMVMLIQEIGIFIQEEQEDIKGTVNTGL